MSHHPALAYADIGAFMRDLREESGMAALALQQALAATGQGSLERIKQRLRQGNLALAAAALAARD